MCLLDLNSSVELGLEGGTTRDFVLSRQLSMDRSAYSGPLADVESNLIAAVSAANDQGVADVIGIMESVLDQDGERTHISRVLWKAATQAPPHLADTIISSSLFTFNFVDDINGRTCLHEAAISGTLRLVSHCVENNIEIDKPDAYGRSALHYASMYGHDLICQRLLLLGAQPNAVDLDNYTPLIYAVVNGKLECVRVLLEDGHIGVEHVEATNSLIPLSLACQFGHVGVALLLLQHGARNVANTNGEYPIHLAAREGHEAICRLLVGQDVTDVPDKYNEWTPLFHAARYGHEKCVTVLLDAGCNPHTVDETSKLAVFYAAWYGHINCVNRLIAVMKAPSISTGTRARVVTSVSPLSDLDAPPEGDLDMIPSLSLPPPIMPFRIYGHDFLDKTYLLQLTLGLPSQNLSSASSSFTLVPNIAGFVEQQHQQSGPSFKLVISAKPDPMSAPHAIVLPLTKTQEIFSFQLPSLEGLAVEFSFYPTFGNKIVGRAVALLSDLGNENGRTLPVFDHHLQVIGQVCNRTHENPVAYL